MSDRDLTTTRRQVFGDVAPGTECRVCGRAVDDGRAKMCSQYCRDIVTAVMGLLNWSSVRRRVIDRDDQTCRQCGYDHARERAARDHLRGLIDEYAGERPDPVPLGEPDQWDGDDVADYRQQMDQWRERREEAKAIYGDPYSDYERTLEVDHITPIADGGHPFDPANLQTLCSECHSEKTAAENSDRGDQPDRGDLSRELFEFVGGDA